MTRARKIFCPFLRSGHGLLYAPRCYFFFIYHHRTMVHATDRKQSAVHVSSCVWSWCCSAPERRLARKSILALGTLLVDLIEEHAPLYARQFNDMSACDVHTWTSIHDSSCDAHRRVAISALRLRGGGRLVAATALLGAGLGSVLLHMGGGKILPPHMRLCLLQTYLLVVMCRLIVVGAWLLALARELDMAHTVT
jgi:hypothetical protein